MRPRSRAWILGAFPIVLLFTLVRFAPPDGGERAELAQFVGRFHPIAVHIPIALLFLVPILEGAALFRRQRELRQAAGFVLGIAAVGAVLAAFLGWLLAWSGGYQGVLVTQHMYGGFWVAAASLICWRLFGRSRFSYAVVLFSTICLLIWTGDLGGKLTHGATFLTEYMPFAEKKEPPIDPTSFYATRVQPIFNEKCILCHGADKSKGGLRLDSYGRSMRGGKDGLVVHAGDPATSELFRRVTLPAGGKGFMPAEGKPALTEAEIKVIEVWIKGGATPQIAATGGLPEAPKTLAPLTADYRPQMKIIEALEASLGVQLVPRSQNPTDGLILRTASAPDRCNDDTLQKLAPIAGFIVDAELARSKVTDKGLESIAVFSNLRFLDLTHTAVTSAGMKQLTKLEKLESLNLTDTKVTQDGVSALATNPAPKKIYLFNNR
jgi:mono/diheme cytochrome c family protein